jgi:hypothetical protein
MSKAQAQKGKVVVEETFSQGKDFNAMLLSDTNHFNGIKGCPNWNEMYRIFINEDFPKDDEDLVVYQNIKKSELYAIATRLDIMPYNDTM